MLLARETGLSSNVDDKIESVWKALNKENKTLKRQRETAERQQKYRLDKKQKMNDILQKQPEVAAAFKTRGKPGRPRIEETQPQLLKVLTHFLTIPDVSNL